MDNTLAFRAMNTDFLVAGLSAGEAAEVKALVEQAERTFSRFSPESEISGLNRTTGDWTAVSSLTYDLLAEAIEAYQATEGLFDPFLADTMRKIGYDRSFETLMPPTAMPGLVAKDTGSMLSDPAAEKNEGVLQSTRTAPLEMDFRRQCVKLAKESAIDVGGIAKGWIAQQAANRLLARGVGQGLVDAGGDVVLWGKEPEQGSWGVGIGHPLGKEEDLADLWLEGLAAIATSSIVKRRWQREGQIEAHHILDPRTGNPARSDLLQATVIARDLVAAEQYAKCLIILGSEEGRRWMSRKRPDLGYIMVRRDGAVLHSDNLDLFTKDWRVDSHVELDDDIT